MNFIQYNHHGKKVWVKKDIKGCHRSFCLCFSCRLFGKGSGNSDCEIANAVYKNCVEFNIVSPVMECPNFKWSCGDE